MPIENLFRKISGRSEISNLDDFNEELKDLIAKVKRLHLESKETEVKFQKDYDEKMSELDFSGSKRAVEDSRRQLARTLDLEVQLEFLENIRKLITIFLEKELSDPLKFQEFQKLAYKILDLKKISSRSNRSIFLKRIKKFSRDKEIDLFTDETELDIDKILQEVSERSNSINSEVDKLIKEIQKKKRDQ
jgi:hypothetical protein